MQAGLPEGWSHTAGTHCQPRHVMWVGCCCGHMSRLASRGRGTCRHIRLALWILGKTRELSHLREACACCPKSRLVNRPFLLRWGCPVDRKSEVAVGCDEQHRKAWRGENSSSRLGHYVTFIAFAMGLLSVRTASAPNLNRGIMQNRL